MNFKDERELAANKHYDFLKTFVPAGVSTSDFQQGANWAIFESSLVKQMAHELKLQCGILGEISDRNTENLRLAADVLAAYHKALEEMK